MNWQDNQGGFHRLDATLAKGSDGRWRPKSAPLNTSFADSVPAGGTNAGGAHTVQLDGPGWSIGFDPASDPALSASVTSSAATYSLGGGVSLVEQATVDGVKEGFLLPSAPSGTGDVSYDFGLDTSGATPSVDQSGLIVFTAADGSVVASVPSGVAVDSKIPAPAVSPVTVALLGGAGAWRLRVTASGAWLRDSHRVYPAMIDPSLQAGRGGTSAQDDAFVYNGTPTTTYNGAAQYVPALANYVDGVGVQGADQYETFLKWNLAPVIGTGKSIASASLSLASLAANPAAGTSYQVWVLGQDFTASSVTWNHQPSTTSSWEYLSAAAPGGQATATLTNEVAAWANGQLPTFGGWADVAIEQAQVGVNGTTDFGAVEATGGGDPVLQVTYTDLPPATISFPGTSTVTCPGPDHAIVACPPTVGSTSPTVTLSQAGNPAGHTLSYWYQIVDGDNGTTIPPSGNYGDVVQSGWVTSTSWTPPPGSLVNGRSYNVYVYTSVDGVLYPPAQSYLAVKLVDPSVSPTDSAGPVTVNLANGAPVVSLASQNLTSAGGSIGLGLDYDPQRAATGVQGSYYSNCNSTTSPWPKPAVTRPDPLVDFSWGNDAAHGTSAYGVVPAGSYCAYWSGFLTVPYTGVWQLGAGQLDDGMIIQIAGTTVFSEWADHTGYHEFCVGVTTAVCNQTLTAGVAYPISVWYYHHQGVGQIMLSAKGPINPDGSYVAGQLNELAVPAPWLTPPNRALPAGWRLSVPTDVAAYTSATVTATGVTLNSLDGPGQTYSWNGSTYRPPIGETAALRWVTEGGASVLKAADGDVTYTFDITGKLLSTVAGADLTTPTSPSYTYDATSGQPTRVTDPVSGRHLDVTYGSRSGGSDPNCHISAAGFDADPPVGMACKVTLPDGSTDRLDYTGGLFSRFVTSIASGSTNPFGGNITDMGYDAQGRLTSIRDPLASDQVAAGLATADTTSATVIAYDLTTGKTASVTAPKAQSSATTRVTHSYEYTSTSETRVHAAGFTEPSGTPWARKITFDANGRVTTDTDPASHTSTTSYDNLDQPIVATDPTGMRTTTFYDPEGRPTDSFGPAASGLFDSTDRPATGNTGRVAHTVTGYDESMHGLAVEYYNSTDLSGAPVARALAIGKGGNDFYNSYPAAPAPGVGATSWSARYTGRIAWPTTGSYTLNIASAGGARLILEGAYGTVYVDDAWAAHGASWAANPITLNETAGTTSKITIEYYNTTYNPGLVQLNWTGAQSGDTPTSALSPDLGLATSTTDADGRKTATEYARPELGTVSATVADPAGLALRTTQASDNLLRPIGQRLPANTYPQAVKTDNPAGYWRLDDHTYETLGDASGHNLAGSYGGPGVTLAQPSALVADDDPTASFNGSTGTATIPDNASLRLDRSAPFSVEAWLNTTSTGTMVIASKMANASPYTGWEIGLTGGVPYLMLNANYRSNYLYRYSSINIADGHWHHLVATYDGSSHAAGINFYTDANLDAHPITVSDTLTASAATTLPLAVGSRAASALFFLGSLDDIAVYPTALGGARITAHAQAGNTGYGAVTTAYYSTGDTAPTNTCGGVPVVGLDKQTTDADPDGPNPAQPITHQEVYDTMGRSVGSRIPGDAAWSCTSYDARGRVGSVTDSAGHQTTSTYNDATAPGTVIQGYVDSSGAQRSTTSVLDLLSRIISYTDEQGGTTTTSYDQAGRQTDTYRAIFGGAQTHLTNITYDAYNRPSTSSEYLSGTPRTTSTGYDAQGRPQTTTLPNGVVTSSGYDADRGYLSVLTNITGGGTHLSDWSYHHTLGDKIDTETNTGVRTRSYTYDQAGRLTQANEGTTTRPYAYDANTNRCALAAVCDGTWHYNGADQLTASPEAAGYTYNGHGQLTSANRSDGNSETIGYDASDHPTTIDDGTSTISETLASNGRVLERTVTNDSTHASTEDTLYGYRDSSDSPAYARAAVGGPVTTYIGPCADVAGIASWEIQNAHGDVVGSTDANAVYTANPITDEFGVGMTSTSRLGYLGGKERFVTDTILGLVRMGVRLYDPTLGRFLETDPVPGGSANAYDYVNQDPINSIDLAGTWPHIHCGICHSILKRGLQAAAFVTYGVYYAGYTLDQYFPTPMGMLAQVDGLAADAGIDRIKNRYLHDGEAVADEGQNISLNPFHAGRTGTGRVIHNAPGIHSRGKPRGRFGFTIHFHHRRYNIDMR